MPFVFPRKRRDASSSGRDGFICIRRYYRNSRDRVFPSVSRSLASYYISSRRREAPFPQREINNSGIRFLLAAPSHLSPSLYPLACLSVSFSCLRPCYMYKRVSSTSADRRRIILLRVREWSISLALCRSILWSLKKKERTGFDNTLDNPSTQFSYSKE